MVGELEGVRAGMNLPSFRVDSVEAKDRHRTEELFRGGGPPTMPGLAAGFRV